MVPWKSSGIFKDDFTYEIDINDENVGSVYYNNSSFDYDNFTFDADGHVVDVKFSVDNSTATKEFLQSERGTFINIII